ncbi:MAG: helix-turn-helix domain-containing protein [Exilibacterium sp.]
MDKSDCTDEDFQTGAFGRLMRFWRNVFGYSQVQLAHRLKTSTRHISFLETGRSNPSRAMISRLAQELGLSEREKNVLMVAAGFIPDSPEIDLSDFGWLRSHLSLLMAKQDPYPALVVDRCGDIKMCNRALLLLIEACLSGNSLSEQANLFHLYFSDEGLRQRIQSWEKLSCILLLKVQEQQLLSGDERLGELVEWLQAYPGVPADWALRAQGIEHTSSYEIRLQLNQMISHSLAVITNVEPLPNFSAPQFFIHSYFPKDKATQMLWQSFYDDRKIQHPLLYY